MSFRNFIAPLAFLLDQFEIPSQDGPVIRLARADKGAECEVFFGEFKGAEFFGADFEDIPKRVPDVSALAEAIGFEASIDLDEGLGRTLDAVGLLSVPHG